MNEPTTPAERTPVVNVSTLLPADVRQPLIEASKIDPDKAESVRRAAAISRATGIARIKYPQLFKE